jgi:hypothetical protein
MIAFALFAVVSLLATAFMFLAKPPGHNALRTRPS